MDKNNIINYKARERVAGEFSVTLFDPVTGLSPPTIYADNLIVDVGLKWLGDILAGVESTDTSLAWIEPGESAAATTNGMTDVQDALEGAPGPGRQAATLITREALTPFEVVVDLFIDSTDYTRTQTITELCVFFKSTGADNMFARGVLDIPVVLSGTLTATVSYGVMFR